MLLWHILSSAHTTHVDLFLLKSVCSFFLPFLLHLPSQLSFFYPLIFTLFCLGSRTWWCLSNGNQSQWRPRKTRLSPFLWICHLQSLCCRGKGSVPKNIDLTIMVVVSILLQTKYAVFWNVLLFILMFCIGFMWFVTTCYETKVCFTVLHGIICFSKWEAIIQVMRR